jgi:hypothetical protein
MSERQNQDETAAGHRKSTGGRKVNLATLRAAARRAIVWTDDRAGRDNGGAP